jgi:hypothetical protein
VSELLCHLFGDYVIQNHWMATNKTRSLFVAAVHALTYTLPFLCITGNPWSLATICGTHVVIDRYRLAGYWCRIWGTGCTGWLWSLCGYCNSYSLGSWDDYREMTWEDAPDYLRIWLLIIVDNTIHLTINHFALA